MLHGYSNSDWVGSVDNMKSTSCYCFSFGSGMFSWCSRKQDNIAQSTAKIEYAAITAAVNQAIWIRKILTDLHINKLEPTKIYVDNQAYNPVFHGRTKHFKIKLYFLREAQKEEEVTLLYCRTNDQITYVLTKALSKASFEDLRRKLGICCC